MASPPTHTYSHSALIFSGSLLHKLENSLRLPTSYVGVRRVRPSGGSLKKLDADGSGKSVSDQNDDEWTPTAIDTKDRMDNNKVGGLMGADEVANRKANEISFTITNPDGTKRRMTKQEKKQLKYKLAQAKRDVQREKRQIKHEQLIKEAKKAKHERKRLKRLERQERKKQLQQKEDDKELSEQEQEVCKETSFQQQEVETEIGAQKDEASVPCTEIDEEMAALRGERSGIPPAMLAPAAAFAATRALECAKRRDDTHTKTVFDRQLTIEWANQLQQSMIPAEELRAKEDMRPMAYKVVPELWHRLCPKSLWSSKDEEDTRTTGQEASNQTADESVSLGLIRHPSPLYDEAAYAVFQHLHEHSNLHISSGGIFGCDFLLYDGKREDRHSFAGLRIYTSEKDASTFPMPSAYDLTGFVRTMNTARKLALIATVVKDEREGGTARVLIVDLALEKILSVETHKKKGNTEKRKSEMDTSSCLAKLKK